MGKIHRINTILVNCVSVIALFLATIVPILSTPQIASANTNVSYRYTKTIDAVSGYAFPQSVATDKNGNVYVEGAFNGTVDFDGVGGSSSVTSGDTSVFLSKYSNNGTYQWTKTFDASDSGNAWGYGVATDSSGNVFITGYFTGTIVFDGPGGTDSKTQNNSSTFLTKYNSDGSYSYTKIFDTSSGYAASEAIAIDSQGNIYLTGTFNGTVIFDGPGGTDSQTQSNSSSYITKYNSNGTYGYTKVFDSSDGSSYGYSIAVDSSGNIFTTGDFTGTIVFDGPGGTDSQTQSNSSSYITKYNSNGTYAYTKILDSSGGYSASYGITTDPNGNVYAAGVFNGTVVFDGPGGTDSQTQSNYSSYLVKYKANGSYGYTKIYDINSGNSQPVGVATDSLGDVYMESGWNGTVTFDGPGGTDTQTTSNGNSALTMYNPDGSYAWTKVFDTTNGNTILGEGAIGSIATDSLGNVYIAGGFYFGTVVFDGPGGTDSQTATSTDGLLTSYKTFVPPATSNKSNTATQSVTPTAPNTGYGTPSRSAEYKYALSLFISALVLSAAILVRKTSSS